MHIYSLEEQEELLGNPNVKNCSPRSITYNEKFKQAAVKSYYNDGLSPNEIFKAAGFKLNVIGRSKPKSLLRDWRKIYKTKGEIGLLGENRGRMGGRNGGRKPKTKESKDIEYLNAKVAYLEAENAFLKSLKTKTNN